MTSTNMNKTQSWAHKDWTNYGYIIAYSLFFYLFVFNNLVLAVDVSTEDLQMWKISD